MTYGQQLAVIILTAKELEFNARYIAEAEKILLDKKIPRSTILSVEKESTRCVDLIIRSSLTNKAQEISKRILNDKKIKHCLK